MARISSDESEESPAPFQFVFLDLPSHVYFFLNGSVDGSVDLRFTTLLYPALCYQVM